MKLPGFIHRRLVRWANRIILRRRPDVIIGGHDRPYLARWFVIPRNPLFNIYLHEFYRSDDDRALHDHPWFNVSVLLDGQYVEHTISAGGIHRRTLRQAGELKLRSPWAAHRIELLTIAHFVRSQPDNDTPLPCTTLFITGPRLRAWGFHCPDQGWIHWKRFTAADDPGAIGKGCEG